MELHINLLLNKKVILKSIFLFFAGLFVLAIVQTFLRYSCEWVLNTGHFERNFILLLWPGIGAAFSVLLGLLFSKFLRDEESTAYKSIIFFMIMLYALYSVLFWSYLTWDFMDYMIMSVPNNLWMESTFFHFIGTFISYFLSSLSTEIYLLIYIFILIAKSMIFRKKKRKAE